MEPGAATYPALVVEEERSFLVRVMGWMFTGLAFTGVVAWAIGTSEDAVAWFDDHPWVFIALIVAQLVLVAGLAFRIQNLSPQVAAAVFLGYAALNGVTFSMIFAVYTTASIAGAFFVTSAMFGALALFGWTTKRDLSSVGSIAFMALIGLILASVVNLFWANGTLYWITTYAGVAIFSALTAYDMQKIKELNVRGNTGTDADKREAILGALALYLDFINLFLFILRIFGRSK
ncbi:MAG TPA: Bax inhibitor-1/YccA family protein [Gaiellaceae bacterium]|jgi:FtsH-binding integral membrane protein|nr:Bax inhibitor-1/YccA family protein [Gaiellaceae bacterium]